MTSMGERRNVARALLPFVLALVLIGVLAGCSASSSGESDEGATETESEAAEEAVSEEAEAAAEEVDIDELLASYATSLSSYLAGNTYDGYFHMALTDYYVYTFVATVPELPLTWYVADFDSDGQSELLVIFTDLGSGAVGNVYLAEDDAVLTMYEVDVEADYTIEAVAEYTIECAAVSSYEEASTQWGVFEREGAVYLVYESWSQASYLADGVALVFVELLYDGEEFQAVVDASISGSDFTATDDEEEDSEDAEDAEEPAELDGGAFSEALEAAGISVEFAALVNHTATICGTALNATIFCTTTTTPVIDIDEFESWLNSGDSEIVGTSIVVTGQGA